jgi:hypothetical protein
MPLNWLKKPQSYNQNTWNLSIGMSFRAVHFRCFFFAAREPVFFSCSVRHNVDDLSKQRCNKSDMSCFMQLGVRKSDSSDLWPESGTQCNFSTSRKKKYKTQLLMFVFKWTATVSGWTWHDLQHIRYWPSNQVSWLVPDKYRPQVSFQPLVKHHVLTLGSRTRCTVWTFNFTRASDLGALFPTIVLTSYRPGLSLNDHVAVRDIVKS